MSDVARNGEDAMAPGGAGDARPSLPAAPPGPAWELVEAGRYRPLRIRGSFPGRELG